MIDEVAIRTGRVWVDGISRYVRREDAHAYGAQGHHVRWEETVEPQDILDVPDQEDRQS